MKTLELCLGTVNFGRDDTKAHHRANMIRVYSYLLTQVGAGRKVVVLLQEIMEGDHYDERAMLVSVFRGFDFAELHGMTPIMSSGLDILRSHSELASPGIAKVTPARYVVDAVYRDSVTGKRLAAVGLHPPQGAFTDPGQSHEAERDADYVANWDLGLERLGVKTRNGHTSVFGGDLNNPRPAPPSLRAQDLINASLDHLWLVPALGSQDKLLEARRHVVNLTIDGHNAQFVTGRLAV